MKPTKITLSILLLMAGFAFSTSCSEDEDAPQEQSPVVQLLSSGKWYLESDSGHTYDEGDCIKESNIIFSENGNDVTEIYIGSEPPCMLLKSFEGTWELLSDTQIAFYDDDDLAFFRGTYTIGSLSEEELVLERTIPGGGSATIVLDKNPG